MNPKQSEEEDTVLTDEKATTSKPPPTPPGNSAPTNLTCPFAIQNCHWINTRNAHVKQPFIV